MTDIQQQLFAMQDLNYKQFHSSLMPTINPDTVIGVRMPSLRKYGAALVGTEAADAFIKQLPHTYYEENNLHGIIIGECRDFEESVRLVDEFLPYVDNWATCDLLMFKTFAKNKDKLITHIRRWMASDRPYTIRFGMEMLMKLYLDEAFRPEYLALAAGIRSDEYYVNMMTAWFFATALARQYAAALPYITGHRLDKWTHNKAIQKCVESRRITPEQKEYLRTLRI